MSGLSDLIEKVDFSITTWLAFGATLQLLGLVCLPTRIVAIPPLSWLLYRLFKCILDSRDVYKTSFTDTVRGARTARLPGTSDGVVVFVLGSRVNHPFKKLVPGVIHLDAMFQDMWREAENNRSKWGYLGRTAPMFDSSDHEGVTAIWISYWRDVESLQRFAAASAHMLGRTEYEAGKHPYVGVFHETYHAPKGSYETIYSNFPRWGLGASKVVVGEEGGYFALEETLFPNEKGSHMFVRMGRKSKG